MSLQSQKVIKEKNKDIIKEPKLYNVIMLNDDFTTMEFVVSILMDIFHKDQATAEALMLTVHKEGSAVVGKYPYDIAVTKVTQAMARAREKGFPFRLRLTEE